MTGSRRPLEGTTIVALEHAVAVPFATRHLADLGAEIIKIERPGFGDFARSYDSSIRGELATHFAWLNRGKRSLCIDLKQDRGRELLEGLLREADLFVHNLAPGAVERLGFGPTGLAVINPLLIDIQLTGYGGGGPYSGRKAFDLLVQAEAGAVSITGTPDQPSKTGIPIADIAAGTQIIEAALVALLHRAATGEGDHIEVSLFDALLDWMGYPIYRQIFTGEAPPRMGLAHPTVVPYDAYRSADGDLCLIGVQNDANWADLCRRLLEDEDWIIAPETATNEARCANRGLVDDLVATAARRHPTAALEELLEEAGIAFGRINDIEAVVNHEHLAARDRWTTIDTEVGAIPALPPAYSSRAFGWCPGPVPSLGEHTSAVLREAGLDAAEIAALRSEGIVA